MVKISCPQCEAKKVYLLSNGKRKYFRCKYEFTPYRLPLYFTREQWREINRWFLLEQCSQNIALIALRTGFEPLKWMKPISGVNGRIIEGLSEIL